MRCVLLIVFVFCSVSFTWQLNTLELTGVCEIHDPAYENPNVFACVEYPEEYSRCNGILAVNIETDEELWFFETESDNDDFQNTPYNIQYHDNRIYAAVSHLGILCLNAYSGTEEFLWEHEGYSPDFILDSGDLYAATFSKLVKLDACTGELIWELPIQREASDIPLNLCDIYLGNGKLIAGFIQPAIFCVDPSTGEIIWRNEDILEWRGNGYSGASYVSDSSVFASAQAEGIIVLDTVDGSLSTFYKNSRYLAGDNDGVYLLLRENDENYLCMLDPVTGELSIRVSLDDYNAIYCLEILDDLLCFGGWDGQLCVLPRNEIVNISDCSYRKNVSAEDITVSVYGDRIFAISDDGVIFSINSQLEDELEIETGFDLESPRLFSDCRCVIPAGNRLLILEF